MNNSQSSVFGFRCQPELLQELDTFAAKNFGDSKPSRDSALTYLCTKYIAKDASQRIIIEPKSELLLRKPASAHFFVTMHTPLKKQLQEIACTYSMSLAAVIRNIVYTSLFVQEERE